MHPDLIAPCGMNCALCVSYQSQKYDLRRIGLRRKTCPGCIPRGKHCTHMGDSCEALKEGRLRFCFACGAFPCKRLKALDLRYKAKYHMSMIENLKEIRDLGMQAFLEAEAAQWACGVCGEPICCHNGLCLHCSPQAMLDHPKYRWGEETQSGSDTTR